MLVDRYEVSPLDKIDGLYVQAVTHAPDGRVIATLCTLEMTRPVTFDGKCFHEPVWAFARDEELTGLVEVERGIAPPPPEGCTCS